MSTNDVDERRFEGGRGVYRKVTLGDNEVRNLKIQVTSFMDGPLW